MNKKSMAERNDFNFNFLKTIIIRFDYSGLSENELEKSIVQIKELLCQGKYKYNRMYKKLRSEIQIQLNDPDMIDDEARMGNNSFQQVYVFENETNGIQLILSTDYVMVLIEKKKYVNFENYGKVLQEVVKLLADTITFFYPVRFGLRKINQCILEDIQDLNNYFSSDYFKFFSLGSDSNMQIFQAKDCFDIDEYKVNYQRAIIRGKMENKSAYQVLIDSEIYLRDAELILEILKDFDRMKTMNEILFEIYLESITSEFIEKLKKKEFHDDKIMEVEKNE